jgi:glucose/arabinose dehydrogenase
MSRFSLADLVDDLPGPGNYHTNMVTFGPDGRLYFSQGAMTNTGVVGLDAYALGWLRRLPHAHDLPGYDITLTGVDFETEDPLNDDPTARARTGAFAPFGTQTEAGQRVSAQLPCTAAVMRCDPDGSNLDLVAWGLRNAYGLGFLPDGRLLAADQGADDRGSRPMGNVPDMLFEIQKGEWYGWSDFIGDEPITAATYRPERGPAPTFVLANHDELPSPRRPLLRFPPHSAVAKFDVAPKATREWAGQIFAALFGDETPMTAPDAPPAGRTLVRIDPDGWNLHEITLEGLSRPIDVRFDPVDGGLYIIDFGRFEMHGERGVVAEAGTGRVWRLVSFS